MADAREVGEGTSGLDVWLGGCGRGGGYDGRWWLRRRGRRVGGHSIEAEGAHGALNGGAELVDVGGCHEGRRRGGDRDDERENKVRTGDDEAGRESGAGSGQKTGAGAGRGGGGGGGRGGTSGFVRERVGEWVRACDGRRASAVSVDGAQRRARDTGHTALTCVTRAAPLLNWTPRAVYVSRVQRATFRARCKLVDARVMRACARVCAPRAAERGGVTLSAARVRCAQAAVAAAAAAKKRGRPQRRACGAFPALRRGAPLYAPRRATCRRADAVHARVYTRRPLIYRLAL
ncbi:hypothetical protein FGB62_23g222 [Gracilaria domingensis]|nr:hypothetical protein FGB62_23g222 [Gracilaria domingensis]